MADEQDPLASASSGVYPRRVALSPNGSGFDTSAGSQGCRPGLSNLARFGALFWWMPEDVWNACRRIAHDSGTREDHAVSIATESRYISPSDVTPRPLL